MWVAYEKLITNKLGPYSSFASVRNMYASKNLMQMNVVTAVPKTTETGCRDGSVQERHGIQRLHK